MRELAYLVHTSLDGCIEGPNGEFDWAAMGPELSGFSQELNVGVDTFAYGRKVWDMMAGYWPNVESLSDHPHDLAFAPIWREMPKIVFSRTLEKADWNTRVLGGDLAAEVTALKQEPGENILLMGGVELAGELTRLGLVDEYLVVVHPVVLGGTRRPFLPETGRFGLELIETRTFDARAVLLRYRRA